MTTLHKHEAYATDAELEQTVTEFIHSNGRLPLHDIEVEAHEGIITLRGTVGSFYEKQLCIQSCKRVRGLAGLVDLIEVIQRLD